MAANIKFLFVPKVLGRTLAIERQVLSLTRAPVIATHSGLKAIVDVPRNLSDEALDLIRKNGGVVQVVGFSNYLRKAPEASEDT